MENFILKEVVYVFESEISFLRENLFIGGGEGEVFKLGFRGRFVDGFFLRMSFVNYRVFCCFEF